MFGMNGENSTPNYAPILRRLSFLTLVFSMVILEMLISGKPVSEELALCKLASAKLI